MEAHCKEWHVTAPDPAEASRGPDQTGFNRNINDMELS